MFDAETRDGILSGIERLIAERIAPRAAEIDESHEFPWDVVELYREHELFGLLFDEEWGGTGTGRGPLKTSWRVRVIRSHQGQDARWAP